MPIHHILLLVIDYLLIAVLLGRLAYRWTKKNNLEEGNADIVVLVAVCWPAFLSCAIIMGFLRLLSKAVSWIPQKQSEAE